jgi:hypothetical protein
MRRLVLIITLLATFSVAALPAAADPSPSDELSCSADPLVAMDDGCTDAMVSPEAAAALAQAQAAAPALADDLPPWCRLHAEAVFWTAVDWPLLAGALADDPSPCADYYVSIPPQSADHTLLRGAQDDLIRALGPHIHPIAEMTLGTLTGWDHWVHAVPGRTWLGAGVEFRRRMAAAGHRFDLGETWLLNEFDRSTRLDEPPYTRAAMRDLLRGLYDGGGTLPPVQGIVEIGIAYTHQNIPDVAGYKAELKSWLQDADFWEDVAGKIKILTKETYPDARFWGVAGSSRHNRTEHLTEYMEHLNNLVESGPRSLSDVQTFMRSSFMPLGSATWPAFGPDPFSPPFCCGHGWTMIPLEEMLHLISEQVYAVRHYAGSHPHGAPAGRLGFSWQPTNNFGLPAAEWLAARQALAARIASAIHYAYREGGASAEGACSPPDSGIDWCAGGDVPDATFDPRWAMFESWN